MIFFCLARENAKNMYNTVSASSGLITGTQWDVILKKLVEKTDLEENALTMFICVSVNSDIVSANPASYLAT